VVIAAVRTATGCRRGRTCTAALAEVSETAVHLHGRTLAAELGTRCDGPLDPKTGYQVTRRLRADPIWQTAGGVAAAA
jgi:hypothetical protein